MIDKVELMSGHDWSHSPNGDGLYKIRTQDGETEYAVVWGKGNRTRICEVENGGDSELISHSFYENALFLGPLTEPPTYPSIYDFITKFLQDMRFTTDPEKPGKIFMYKEDEDGFRSGHMSITPSSRSFEYRWAGFFSILSEKFHRIYGREDLEKIIQHFIRDYLHITLDEKCCGIANGFTVDMWYRVLNKENKWKSVKLD